MSAYYFMNLEVENLWGYKEIKIDFNKDVNILIGPNASGKTTILNLLNFVRSADVIRLGEIEFDKIILRLKSFDDGSLKTVKVVPWEKGFRFYISKKFYELLRPEQIRYMRAAGGTLVKRRVARPYRTLPLRAARDQREVSEILSHLIPFDWLPVSRRLPIPEDSEEFEYERSSGLDSVDERLSELLIGLMRYRHSLDSKLAEHHKEFEKRVLQTILYSKKFDHLGAVKFRKPTPEDKDQIIRAFKAAGLLDQQMNKRIEEHFAVSSEAIDRMEKVKKKAPPGFWEDLFVLPLIGRTKSIVEFARTLEEERATLFKPLRKYESLVSSFFNDKIISVRDGGELRIVSEKLQQEIGTKFLSSGEKQILILLTQAVLREDQPVVYVADEPELSLHVSWQEKLLTSLLDLGQQIQIIVATHSPDIIGPYIDNVLDLGKQ